MKHRTRKAASRKPRLAVVGIDDAGIAVRAAFAEHGQMLLPILELVESASQKV